MEEYTKKDDAPRILIVDDVETNRYVLRNIITDMGCQPVLATNGVQAQKMLKKTKISLILLDIAMPEMDGYEFCRWQKEDPKYKEIPTIFISAYDNPNDVVKGFEAGGEDYITKPFISEVVQARVSIHLRLYNGTQQVKDTNRRLHASVQQQLVQMEKEKKNVLYALAEVARENANYDETHSERLSYNCKLLAQAMQLSPRYEHRISDTFVEIIEIAAPLCDVGNVTVPIAILKKDEYLTPEEHSVMEAHTTAGARLFRKLRGDEDYNDFLEMAENIAHYHHENWDGSGYPEGREKDEIPLEAQIVSLVGAYCSLREKRLYRPAYNQESSFAMITLATGVRFNEELVKIFFKIARQLK